MLAVLALKIERSRRHLVRCFKQLQQIFPLLRGQRCMGRACFPNRNSNIGLPCQRRQTQHGIAGFRGSVTVLKQVVPVLPGHQGLAGPIRQARQLAPPIGIAGDTGHSLAGHLKGTLTVTAAQENLECQCEVFLIEYAQLDVYRRHSSTSGRRRCRPDDSSTQRNSRSGGDGWHRSGRSDRDTGYDGRLERVVPILV